MIFANPQAFQLLILIPILLLIAWFAPAALARRKGKFVKPYLFGHLAGARLPVGVGRRMVYLCVAIALLACAAARPQFGYEERKIRSRGIDLIVAIDVSNSMLAADHKPNRLARAKAILQDILWTAKGNRIGVVAFAGSAQIKCPLTLDYAMAKTALQTLETASVGTPGTNLGNAIDASIRAFETGSSGERVLVLLTDGEDHEQEIDRAVKVAAEKQVRVYTVGIGTSEGVPIPTSDSSYKRDKDGKIINSRLNVDALTQIADGTGGMFLQAGEGGNAVAHTISAQIEQMIKVDQQDQTFKIYIERYHWLLIPAIVILLFEMLLIPRRNRFREKGGNRA